MFSLEGNIDGSPIVRPKLPRIADTSNTEYLRWFKVADKAQAVVDEQNTDGVDPNTDQTEKIS